MKKIVVFTLLIVLIIPANAFAKSGDIAGVYYTTDIKTMLNGYEIDAINIGGQTLINAEDMHFYSFYISYSDAERELRVDRTTYATNGVPPTVAKSELPSGSVLGNYYETDIVTYLDGREITAYNIGGRTYIWAEEMRKLGYVVEWYGEERLLDITSPDRAGYEYSINLSEGKSATEEGVGNFSIDYAKGGIVGTGDADHFISSLYCSGTGYSISMKFYQNVALFYSSGLLEKLFSYCCDDVTMETPVDPSLKYDIINQALKIEINGYRAQNIAVYGGAGNGHKDFALVFDGVPIFKESEIESVHFSIDRDEAAEKYNIVFTEYIGESVSKITDKLKANFDDHMHAYYASDDYFVIIYQEVPSFGICKYRLYLVDRADNKVLYDILEKVKEFDGYNYDELKPFDIKIGAMPDNIFFACQSPEKNGNFYVEAKTGVVHFISEYDR